MRTDVSLSYAGALYSVAADESRQEQFLYEMSVLSELFEKNGGYIKLLDDPDIDYTIRLNLIDEAFSGSVSQEIVSFMKILCRRRLMSIFLQCASEFKKLYDSDSGVVTAEVISAVELTEDEKIKLKNALEKKFSRKVELKCSTDRSLIGGFTVSAQGKVIDYSIKNRLKQIREMSGV